MTALHRVPRGSSRGLLAVGGAALALTVAPGCVEYAASTWADIGGVGPREVPGEWGLQERCDGLDNDLDGAVDEGYDDRDGDGVADCVDGTCEVETFEETSTDEASACEGQAELDWEPPADPWDVEILWEGEYSTATGTSAAVYDFGSDGIAEVMLSTSQGLYMIDGSDGELLWHDEDARWYSPLAVADADRDGEAGLFTIDHDGSAVRYDVDGEITWRTSDVAVPDYSNSIADSINVVDLHGDGDVEVITSYFAVSHENQDLLSYLPDYWDPIGGEENIFPALSDIDIDGSVEIIVGSGSVVNGDTWQVEWRYPYETLLGPLRPAFIAGAEEDHARVVVCSDDFRGVLALSAQGEELSTMDYYSPGVDLIELGAPCAGDFDGDGRMDVAIEIVRNPDEVYEQFVSVLSGDLEVLWEAQVFDETAFVACTAFDFDNDGADELVMNDEESLYIFDGRTGAILFEDPSRKSITMDDLPMIVDLDGDGSVEILSLTCVADNDQRNFVAYTHADGGWPPGTSMWPSASWSGTSLNPDGTVPVTAELPWLTTQKWRGQPEFVDWGVDVSVELADWCYTSCEGGDVILSVRLVNRGPQELVDGASVSVYAAGDEEELLGVLEFTGFIDNGGVSATQSIVLTLDEAQEGVYLVAGDPGTGEVTLAECDEDDNSLYWRLEACDA